MPPPEAANAARGHDTAHDTAGTFFVVD